MLPALAKTRQVSAVEQQGHGLITESAMFKREGSDPGFWESFTQARQEDMPAELQVNKVFGRL